MHTMSSVKTESPSSNDLELNIIKIYSLYSQRAITSSTSAIIGRRKFTHISTLCIIENTLLCVLDYYYYLMAIQHADIKVQSIWLSS